MASLAMMSASARARVRRPDARPRACLARARGDRVVEPSACAPRTATGRRSCAYARRARDVHPRRCPATNIRAIIDETIPTASADDGDEFPAPTRPARATAVAAERVGGDRDVIIPDHHPRWVRTMNAALVSDPAWCLVGFVVCDLGSALVFFLLFSALDVPVDADFAMAYALSKSIRAPRLAFDAVVAAKMAAAYPPLAAVRMGPILDAGVDAASRAKRAILRIFRVDDRPSAGTEPEPAEPSAARRAAAEARDLTDKYGLAYMAAKNIIGPVSIVVFYAALRCGVDVQGGLDWLAGGGAGVGGAAVGKTAGLLALSSWASTTLFPAVVLGAGALGPRLGRVARRLGRLMGGKREVE
jgi:hypothetical protein